MKACKFCNSSKLVNNGKPNGVQRYLCKDCTREQIAGDKRMKYENHIKRCAVILYLEGNGIRGIARILSEILRVKIHFQTVTKWLNSAAQIVSEEITSTKREHKNIEIVEMDELFTYIKKNKIKSEYGLLLTGTSSIYLNLK